MHRPPRHASAATRGIGLSIVGTLTQRLGIPSPAAASRERNSDFLPVAEARIGRGARPAQQGASEEQASPDTRQE
jgi:hypothetical protein